MRFALTVVSAFVLMEPLTAATHRWIMHGFGWGLHRSHHRRRVGAFEANDTFPVIFAAIVCAGLFVGFNVDGWSVLIPVGIGVTTYGAAYAVVHDLVIHERLGHVTGADSALARSLAGAHAVHHRTNGAPFGMLLPVVPGRTRGAGVGDVLDERVATGPRT